MHRRSDDRNHKLASLFTCIFPQPFLCQKRKFIAVLTKDSEART